MTAPEARRWRKNWSMEGVQTHVRFLKKKREKRLLKKAARAYRKLDKVK